jgi:hypothetical protein
MSARHGLSVRRAAVSAALAPGLAAALLAPELAAALAAVAAARALAGDGDVGGLVLALAVVPLAVVRDQVALLQHVHGDERDAVHEDVLAALVRADEAEALVCDVCFSRCACVIPCTGAALAVFASLRV